MKEKIDTTEKEIKEEKKNNVLVVEVEVEGKADAFEIVSELGFFHKVLRAKFGDFDEKFDDKHKPANFTRKKVEKTKDVRDVKSEIVQEAKKLTK